ncbi:MAG: autotransporter outer membrane beta-barrel domain-containing protein, partial [Alphaproteobacteria bacterium]|nr:autotransporter outer membrane beta-barrel domain-containing protein [Alphaproteobacteria bacterium]
PGAGGGAGRAGPPASARVPRPPPAETAVTVAYDVSEADGSDVVAAADEGRKSVTIAAGEREAVFTVATVDDEATEADGAVTVTLVAGTGYGLGTDKAASVTVADNDTAEVADAETTTGTEAATLTISPTPVDIYEGETLTFTVTGIDAAHASVLLATSGSAARDEDGDAASGEDIQVKDSSGTVRGASYRYAPSKGTLTFKVTALADDEAEAGDVAVLTLDDPGNALNTVLGALAVKDGKRPVPGVTVSASELALDEGGAAKTYTMVLTMAPDEGSVSIEATVSDPKVASVHGPGGTPGGSAELIFTADDWSVPQTVTVTPMADDVDLDDAAANIWHALEAKGAYEKVTVAHMKLKVADDDRAGVGAPTVSVADARAKESSRWMRFTVSLSHAASEAVTVGFGTRESNPVSARRNRDFMAVDFGKLRFAPGETEKQASIYLFNDNHDEGPETFELALDNPRGATIADGVGIGTIVNSDPMPAAWLARFGRTVAEQALEGIAGRMAAPRAAGMQGSIGGQALSFGPAAQVPTGAGEPQSAGMAASASGAVETASGNTVSGTAALQAMAEIAPGFDGGTGDSAALGTSERFGASRTGWGLDAPQAGQSRTMTGRELLLGSSFSLTGETDSSGGSLAFWGRAAQSSFDGKEGDLALDGTVTTGMLGADYARGRWLVGLALTQSTGEGGYRDTDPAAPPPLSGVPDSAGGKVESSLTAAIPYASLRASDRLSLWGAAGFGAGEVTLTPEGGDPMKADTGWTMAALGMRGDLLAPGGDAGGPALAVVSDAMWANTTSEKTRELAASDSDVTRLRLGLEGSWRVALEDGGTVTPKLELGARHDGGDAETGFGVELGGGIAWSDPNIGLSLDVSGRTLLAHEDGDLKDRGLSAALAFDPDPVSQRGLSLSLRQDMGGRAEGGLDALFANDPLEDRTGSEATSRWAMEAAYGLPAFGGRFVGSPHVGFGLAGTARDYSVGWRLAPEAANAPDLSFGIKATLRESDTAAPEHRIGFEAVARW